MVTSEKHQKALLGGIERFVGVLHPDLIPAVPKILMEFYQVDVLDEELLKQWGTHVSKKYVDRDTSKKVRKASEPFLKVRSVAISCSVRLLMALNSGSTRRRTRRARRSRDAVRRPLLPGTFYIVLYNSYRHAVLLSHQCLIATLRCIVDVQGLRCV